MGNSTKNYIVLQREKLSFKKTFLIYYFPHLKRLFAPTGKYDPRLLTTVDDVRTFLVL